MFFKKHTQCTQKTGYIVGSGGNILSLDVSGGQLTSFRKMKIQIREPYRLPKVMNINEIEKIMRVAYNFKIAAANACNQSFKEKVRNVAVIELLFATGVAIELKQ